jgi:hypothetical protein
MNIDYNNGRRETLPYDSEKFAQKLEQADVRSINVFKGKVKTIGTTNYVEDEHGTLHRITEK